VRSDFVKVSAVGPAGKATIRLAVLDSTATEVDEIAKMSFDYGKAAKSPITEVT